MGLNTGNVGYAPPFEAHVEFYYVSLCTSELEMVQLELTDLVV